MRDFSLRLNEILEMAERTPGFFEVEISFCIRLHEGNESYFLRLVSDADSLEVPHQACLASPSTNSWAVADAECNTVIELKLEHHAA